MARIARLYPHLIQPQYPVEINWNHPIFKDGGQVVCPTLGISQTKESGPYTPVGYVGTVEKSVTQKGVVYSPSGASDITQLVPAYQSLFSLLLLGGVVRQRNPATTNYYGYAGLSNGSIDFGDGGTAAANSRRTYSWPENTGAGAVFVRPGTAITDVPTVYVRGAKQVVSYVSGTGTPYNWAGSHLVATTNANIALLIAVPGQVAEELMSSVSANPWQILQDIERKIWVASAGSGADLAGAAAALATTTAALTQSVPLAGAGIVVATTAGAVSVAVQPSGNAQSQANSTGGLSLSVPFTAAALVSALADAGLSLDKSLSGSGAGEAGSAATILLNVSLAGAPVAEAMAAANLGVVGDGLSGAAVVSPAALGNISLAVGLSGASVAVTNSTGNITQLVPVAGSAASASLTTGGLDISVTLNSAALVEALAAATLSVTSPAVDLSGDAGAVASTLGTLTLRVNLDGAALAAAIAAGALTTDGLIVAGTPGYKVTRTPRSWQVTRTPRSWQVTRTPRSWKASA